MKVYWGSAVGRDYTPENVDSVVNLLGHSRHSWYWKPVNGDALLERSRGASATRFLDSDADVFISVDTDILFHYTDLDALAEQAVTHSLVVGAYSTRSPFRSFPTSALKPHSTIEFVVGKEAAATTPVEIQWGATGFMAVHRRVFEKLAPTLPLLHRDEPSLRHWPFYHTMIHTVDNYPILLSEDYALCERAAQVGFPTYINPAIRLGHVGPYCYRLEDMGHTPIGPSPVRVTRTNAGAPVTYKVERPY